MVRQQLRRSHSMVRMCPLRRRQRSGSRTQGRAAASRVRACYNTLTSMCVTPAPVMLRARTGRRSTMWTASGWRCCSQLRLLSACRQPCTRRCWARRPDAETSGEAAVAMVTPSDASPLQCVSPREDTTMAISDEPVAEMAAALQERRLPEE